MRKGVTEVIDLRRRDGAPPVTVQVWGPAALFTRPEAKVERLTYPVMTPSAAVGVLEAIFWKPEFTWDVAAIEVLKPIRYAQVRRNETNRVVPLDAALKGSRVDTAADRTQRSATYLQEVSYRIHAHVALRPHATEPTAKYRDQFRRRVTRGACFAQPFLGTKEFGASFSDPDEQAPIDLTLELGPMLHSIAYGPGGKNPRSRWFNAALVSGVLDVPTVEQIDAQP